MAFNADQFRATMRLWATGVTIVGARGGDGQTLRGMTASSFTSVTLDPPLILVCLQKDTETSDCILETGSFAVSMLGEGQEEISNLFAGFVPLAEDENRFDRMQVKYATTGAPILANAMGWLDCKVYQTYDGSTHHIFIGEVVEASGQGEEVLRPLLYYNRDYRQLG